MRCDTARELLHEWFDTPGATPLPPELGGHVKECSDCRRFVTRWNSIELGLQSLRQEAPALSGDCAQAVRARLATTTVRLERPWVGRHWRFALAGASAVALLAVLMLYFFSGDALNGAARRPAALSGIARQSPAPNAAEPASSPLAPGYGLANTGR